MRNGEKLTYEKLFYHVPKRKDKAEQAAQPLLDTELHQGRPLPLTELPKPLWLVSSYAQILHDIFTAPRGGAQVVYAGCRRPELQTFLKGGITV